MKKKNLIILISVTIIAIITFILGGSYFSLVNKSKKIDKELKNIDKEFQNRNDIINNLISMLEGYTDYEKETIELVKTSQENLIKSNLISEKSENNIEYANSINKLIVIIETYSELKASDEYVSLSNELTTTNNNLSSSINKYNKAITKYNSTIKKFPISLVSNVFNYSTKDSFKTFEKES